MPFLMTDNGLVNLAGVVEVQETAKGKYFLRGADGENIGIVAMTQLERCIEQMIPAVEPYDCLQVWFNGDEPYVTASNVIGWGISVRGFVYPFTDDEVSPKTENYALRRRGQERVEMPDEGSYENEAAWAGEMAVAHKREKERKVAKE